MTLLFKIKVVMLQIETTNDWQRIESELRESTKNLSFTIQNDLEKINKNICSLVSELSKAEIECRRRKKATRRFLEIREECNSLIKEYQKMILMGQLL